MRKERRTARSGAPGDLARTERRLLAVQFELDVYRTHSTLQNEQLLETQEQLKASRDAYASLYDFAPVAYLTLDARGTVLEANLTAADWLGVPRPELLDAPFMEYVQPWHRERLVDHLRRCEAKEALVETELDLQLCHREGLTVQMRSRGHLRSGAAVPVFQTALTDITALKRYEAELSQANCLLRERAELLASRNRDLQRLGKRLRQAEMRERRTLARLLHDHLQQLLFAAKIRLERESRERPGAAAETLPLLDEALTACRNLAAELVPPVLYESGLAEALEYLVERFRQTYGMDIGFEHDGVSVSDQDLRCAFYDAARELLFNVVKHAQTRRARVQLAHDPELEQLELCVSDDGIGVTDPKAVTGGLGLIGLREQLRSLSGDIEVKRLEPGLCVIVHASTSPNRRSWEPPDGVSR